MYRLFNLLKASMVPMELARSLRLRKLSSLCLDSESRRYDFDRAWSDAHEEDLE